MRDSPQPPPRTRPPMPASRVETQAKVGAGVVAQCLERTLIQGQAADRCLRSHFNANHQLGSRDRRIIGETLFSVLRWWGWLRHLAPKPFVDAWLSSGSRRPPRVRDEDRDEDRNGDRGVSGAAAGRVAGTRLHEWYGCCAAAWFLEDRRELPSSVAWWCRQASVRPEEVPGLPEGAPLRDRRRYLRAFFRGPMPSLPMEALAPSWTPDALDPEEETALDFPGLLDWLQRRPPVWLRAQTPDPAGLREDLAAAGIRARPDRRLPDALRLQGQPPDLRCLEAFRRGRFEIQDLASQAVGFVCAPRPGQQWWDCCAGGGGKTLQLAWMMQGKGSVLATDVRVRKLEELKLRARRAQFPNIRCKEWKGREMPPFRGRFDGVLVDAPCSCSGVWRRSPHLRWTTSQEDLQEFAALQRQLLANAAQGVRPGGVLVYSTCSLFACENRQVVEAFLEGHPDFAPEPFACPLTGRETGGMCQIMPWDGDCDAMFTARLRRRAAPGSPEAPAPEDA